jgi:predicted O-methyltransferase YrrM
VELGSGVSTLIAAYCLRDNGNGKIISLEHDPLYSGVTRDNLHRHGLQHIAEVLDAPIGPVTVNDEVRRWYDVSALDALDSEVDLLIVDGPPRSVQHLARYPALPLLINRLAADAVVLVDDANRNDERETVLRWQSEFPDFTVMCSRTGDGTALFERSQPVENDVSEGG